MSEQRTLKPKVSMTPKACKGKNASRYAVEPMPKLHPMAGISVWNAVSYQARLKKLMHIISEHMSVTLVLCMSIHRRRNRKIQKANHSIEEHKTIVKGND